MLVYFVILFGIILASIFSYKIRLWGLLIRRPEFSARWTSLGPSPDGDKSYPPQGATYAKEYLFLTNHWNGARSVLYKVDPQSGVVVDQARMPEEARHTSGLTWDGTWLWAVDHASNNLYKLDIQETFLEGIAIVDEVYDTGLSGSSGITLVEVDGREYFVISDFIWTIETTPMMPLGSPNSYIIPYSEISPDIPLSETSIMSYHNGGYSQGLTWDGSYLYESLNNIGTDRIEVLDIKPAIKSGNPNRLVRHGSFEGPAGRIEDLATHNDNIWTTDEGEYELYRLESLPSVVNKII